MAAAASASRSLLRRNQRTSLVRTRSVSVARSVGVTGLAGRNATPSGPGLNRPSVTHAGRCTWRLRAEPKRWRQGDGAEPWAAGRSGGGVRRETGRGSVGGSAISPVIKVCANPETYRNLRDDMDIDAGRILEGRGTLDEVGAEIHRLTLAVAAGEKTVSEALGHQEFVLGYKSFEPIGPACHPSYA
jgi:hypothetical protein